MRSLRAKWSFILIAVITNLGGGPMAWAHLAPHGGHCHTMPVAVSDSPGHCHERQLATHERAQPDHSLPCCDGGSCACAALTAPAVAAVSVAPDLRHDTERPSANTGSATTDPLDDTLRPPIR